MGDNANINPIANIYKAIIKILENCVIKFSVKAEKYETMEATLAANAYINAYYATDALESYGKVTLSDIINARMFLNLVKVWAPDTTEITLDTHNKIWEKFNSLDASRRDHIYRRTLNEYEYEAKLYLNGELAFPDDIYNEMLVTKRLACLANYEEQNNYYRELNGYPNIEVDRTKFLYPDPTIIERYNLYYPGFDSSKYEDTSTEAGAARMAARVPIHLIEDVLGPDYIRILEARGVIEDVKADALEAGFKSSEIAYLDHLGTKRIPIVVSRLAKNFEILRLPDVEGVKYALIDEFKNDYTLCRNYTEAVIYNKSFRQTVDYYDNFIGFCIMLQTILQVVNRQLRREISREFFDDNMVMLLYEMYNVPYDMSLDEATQKSICQHLNLLIMHKGSNKVLYELCSLLGFSNADIYQYLLVKNPRYDVYGLPIMANTTKFNTSTGEMETVPDYNKMFDFFFQKVKLGTEDRSVALGDIGKRVDYDDVVRSDPYWIEDDDLLKNLWETAYNYVESKYLGITLSYRMSDIMNENVLLLNALLYHKNLLSDVTFTLPRICPGLDITIFDAIITLCCLISKKHYLKGEIISIPSAALDMMDYLSDIDSESNETVDVMSFDFDWFHKYGVKANRLNSLLDNIRDIIHSDYVKFLDDHKDDENPPYYGDIASEPPPDPPPEGFDGPPPHIMNRHEIDTSKYDISDSKFDYADVFIMALIDRINTELKRLANTGYIKHNGTTADGKPIINVVPILPDKFLAEGMEIMRDTYIYYTKNPDGTIDEHECRLPKAILDEISVELEDYGRVDHVTKYLSDEDAKHLNDLLGMFSIEADVAPETKIETFDKIYSSITGLSRHLNYMLSQCTDRKSYTAIKKFYKAVFYSKQNKQLYQISVLNYFTGKYESRCAKDYFEFLYHNNPKLYSSLFMADYDRQYEASISNANSLKTHLTSQSGDNTIRRYLTWANYERLAKKGTRIPAPYTATTDDYEKFTSFDTNDTLLEWVMDNLDEVYPKDAYISEVELGLIPYDYSTMLDEYDENSVMESRIYYYASHIISRLEERISGVKFMYMLNDAAIPLQSLLLKMLRFFKSYTVDFVDMDTIFISDVKESNIIRLFDEVSRIIKTDYITDEFRIKHSDVIHLIEVTLPKIKDRIVLKDTVAHYSSDITVGDLMCPNDDVDYINKTIYCEDRMKLTDNFHKSYVIEEEN